MSASRSRRHSGDAELSRGPEGFGRAHPRHAQVALSCNDLTILNIVWAPYMTLQPHNHNMWGVIGIYTGREDNIYWRRVPGGNGRLEAAGAKALGRGDVDPLGRDIIHSVTNPIPRLTVAIHVYGGDFFAAERSEWDPETLVEQRWDPERAERRFEEANRVMVGS